MKYNVNFYVMVGTKLAQSEQYTSFAVFILLKGKLLSQRSYDREFKGNWRFLNIISFEISNLMNFLSLYQ